MKLLPFKPLSLSILFLVVFISCKEDEAAAETIDQDMEMAIDLANQFLNSESGRGSAEKAITVLKFKDGKLLFDTNTDTTTGYQEVVETTITATACPGEYIFWFSGGGVSDLEEIDFDQAAEDFLGDIPNEINADLMWVVQVPEEVDTTVTHLKYDIVYQYKDRDEKSDYIRLDPKIRVTQAAEGEEGSNEE